MWAFHPTPSPTNECKDFYLGVPCIMKLQFNIDLSILLDSSNDFSNTEYRFLVNELAGN